MGLPLQPGHTAGPGWPGTHVPPLLVPLVPEELPPDEPLVPDEPEPALPDEERPDEPLEPLDPELDPPELDPPELDDESG